MNSLKALWFVIKSFLLGYKMRDMAIEMERHILRDIGIKLAHNRPITEDEERVLQDIIQNSRFPETRKELDKLQAMLEGK